MKTIKATLIAVALLMGFTSAHARAGSADFSKYADKPVAEKHRYHGAYAGLSVSALATDVSFYGWNEFNNDAVNGGIFLGYDVPLNPYLFVGVRGEYEWNLDTDYGPVENAWSAIARAGVLVTRGAAVYGLAGYKQQQVGSGLPDVEGFLYGAGIEYRFKNRLGISLEAQRFVDDVNFSFDEEALKINVDNTVVRFGVSYTLN